MCQNDCDVEFGNNANDNADADEAVVSGNDDDAPGGSDGTLVNDDEMKLFFLFFF